MRRFLGEPLHGHAAWNAWPWKLHRIEQEEQVRFELYQLLDDRRENNDLSNEKPGRVARVRRDLDAWQRAVLDSWAGKDYAA